MEGRVRKGGERPGEGFLGHKKPPPGEESRDSVVFRVLEADGALAISLHKDVEINAMRETSDMEHLEYNNRDKRYRFRISEGAAIKHAELPKDLLKRFYERRNAE